VRRGLCAGAAAALGLLACGRSTQSELTSTPNDPIPTPELSARRPTVRFYMERTTDRCEVFWVDGADKSPSENFPCPEDMLLGERLRIAGMTCIRESASEERRLPVVCPDPLTNLEKAYRKARFGAP